METMTQNRATGENLLTNFTPMNTQENIRKHRIVPYTRQLLYAFAGMLTGPNRDITGAMYCCTPCPENESNSIALHCYL